MRKRVVALALISFSLLFVSTACFGKSGLSEEDVRDTVIEETKALSNRVTQLEGELLQNAASESVDLTSLNARGVIALSTRQAHASMRIWVSVGQAIVLLPAGAQIQADANGLAPLILEGDPGNMRTMSTLAGDYAFIPSEFALKFANVLAGLKASKGIEIASQQAEVIVTLLADPSLGDTGNELLYQGTLSGLYAGVLEEEHGIFVFKRPAARLIANAPNYGSSGLGVAGVKELEGVIHGSMVFSDVITNGVELQHVVAVFLDVSRFSNEVARAFYSGTFVITFNSDYHSNGAPIFLVRNGELVFGGMIFMIRSDGKAVVLSAEHLLRIPAIMASRFGEAAGVGGDGPPRLPVAEDTAAADETSDEVNSASADSVFDSFESEGVSTDNSDIDSP